MKTMLHVEDSDLIVQRLSEWMVEIDPTLQILSATSLAHATRLLESHTPDFMVLDINLPDGNATSHVAKFKRMAPDMQIAILSSSNDSFTREKCLQLGADWVFDKATDLPKLIGLLTEAPTQF